MASRALQFRKKFEEQAKRQLHEQFDIENADLQQDGALPESLQRKKTPEGFDEQQRRLKSLMDLGDDDDDERYKGKTVTRRQLQQAFDSDESGSEYDEEDGVGFDELLQDDEHRRELLRVRDMLDREEDEYSDEDEDDDDDDDDDSDSSDNENDIDLREHVDSEMIRNDAALLGNVFEQKLKEQTKAKNVLNQKLLFDQLLKLRIMIQKPLAVANRLPQHDLFAQYVQLMEPETQDSLRQVQTMLQNTLKDLVGLQCTLLRKNSHVVESIGDSALTDRDQLADMLEESAIKRRRLSHDGGSSGAKSDDDDDDDDGMSAIWEALHGNYAAYKRYRDESLERWSRRTRLQSIDGQNLRSLNMGILQRVERILRGKDNLIKRTRVNRLSGGKILGKRLRERVMKMSSGDDGDDESDEEEEEEEEEEVEDAEIFDDRDFYQKLLRDLIEDVGSSVLDHAGEGSTSRSLNTDLKQVLARRVKSKDSSARRRQLLGKTKGRTIKYVVHPKMVSFMAPQEQAIPETADALFSNLFGGYWPVPRPAVVDDTEEEDY